MATLTAKDRQEEYDSETLAETLRANVSCRHTARIAHLYLNRTAYLTDKDYDEDLPRLMDRIFGVLETESGQHAEHGWLFRVKDVPDAPRLLAPMLRANLENTFNDVKWSRDQLSSFRVFQLLDPGDRGNLYELIFERENRPTRYYLHLGLLPGHVQAVLPAYLQAGGRDVGLPLGNRAQGFQFYERLSQATSPQNYPPERTANSIALSLEEYYIFRFACWFVFAPSQDPMAMVPMGNGPSSSSSSGGQTRSGKSSTRSGGSGSGDSGGSGGPSRSSQNFLCVSSIHTDDLVRKDPALELLRRYLSRLLPQDASYLTRWGHVFFESLVNLWLLRNVDLVEAAAAAAGPGARALLSSPNAMGGSMVVARPQYGGMTYTSAAPASMRNQYFLAPTHDLLKGMAIFFVYLASDPSLRCGYPKSQRNTTTQGDKNSGALVTQIWDEVGRRHVASEYLLDLGQTPYLRALRKPAYQFFVVNMQKIAKLPDSKSSGLLDVVDLWFSYLEPWRAASRWQPKPSKSQDGVRGAFSAVAQAVRSPTRSLSNERDDRDADRGAGGGGGDDGGDGNGNDRGSGGTGPRSSRGQGAQGSKRRGEAISAKFEPQWMWFVIQNYLTYTHVLQIVFTRMQETSLSDNDRVMVERAFYTTGPFCDPVVCILRACEIVIEDEMLRQKERPLAQELAASFPHLQPILGKESLDASRLNAPRKAESDDLVAIVECMEANRGSIYAILNQHMKDLDWRVEERAIPALLDSQAAVRVILDQIRALVGPSRSSTEAIFARATGGAAFGWIANALTGDSEGKSAASAAERSRVAVSRLHSVFNVPRHKLHAGGARADLADPAYARTATLGAPASRLTLGSPQWLGEQVTCVYRRLTALGRLQMDSGKRVCGSQDMHYVGDPLVNPPPVCSYEIGWLVRLTFSLSLALNKYCGFEHAVFDMDDQADHAWKQSRYRFNLRFIADARNLLLFAMVGLLTNLAFVGVSIPFPYVFAMLASPLAVLMGPDALGEYVALMLWPMAMAVQAARLSGDWQ